MAAKKAARSATTPGAAKRATTKRTAKRPAKKAARKPAKKAARKAAFGRAGTKGKAEGDAPVRAVFASRPREQRKIMERIDAIIAREVPDLKRAIKWSMPTYGRPGNGWFGFLAGFKEHVALGFYFGRRLEPAPPIGGGKEMRSVHYRAVEDVDDKQVASWVRQAAAAPGWGRS